MGEVLEPSRRGIGKPVHQVLPGDGRAETALWVLFSPASGQQDPNRQLDFREPIEYLRINIAAVHRCLDQRRAGQVVFAGLRVFVEAVGTVVREGLLFPGRKIWVSPEPFEHLRGTIPLVASSGNRMSSVLSGVGRFRLVSVWVEQTRLNKYKPGEHFWGPGNGRRDHVAPHGKPYAYHVIESQVIDDFQHVPDEGVPGVGRLGLGTKTVPPRRSTETARLLGSFLMMLSQTLPWNSVA